jgi:hypothetical protein
MCVTGSDKLTSLLRYSVNYAEMSVTESDESICLPHSRLISVVKTLTILGPQSTY